ncbi:MAG: methyltransferase domain-containing protein [Balneolaceae bacterium]
MSTLSYIKKFIKDRDVASITPTSLRAVKNVCSRIDFSKDLLLVEYGPGDGVFSKYILEQMTQGSRLILIESNSDFVDQLRRSILDERVEVHNILAGDVLEILPEEMIGQVDYVLSGIPFSFLDDKRKRDVLRATKRILKKGGTFLAYQTSGHLKQAVLEVFGNLETDFEVLNFPPYLIYDVVKKQD